jgi:hypothetical protein
MGTEQLNEAVEPVASPTPEAAAPAPEAQVAAPEAGKTPAPAADQHLGEVGKAAKGVADIKNQPVVEKKWEPNYKFKVLKEDKELDEKYRNWIKDADSEKSVKEVVSKSMAFDWMKERHQELRSQHQETQAQLEQWTKDVTDLQAAHKRGDFDTIFQTLGIPQEKVLQWVASKLEYNNMSPEQRAVYDARSNSEREAYQLRTQNEQLQAQLHQEAIQTRSFMLDSTLEQPGVKDFARDFDTRAGKPGAFREAIVNHGKMAYLTRGEDLSPNQAIQEVMGQYKGFLQPAAPTAMQPQQAAPVVAATPAQPAKPPIIPNVQGKSGASPAKQKPKSIQDLKNKYYELSGQKTT